MSHYFDDLINEHGKATVDDAIGAIGEATADAIERKRRKGKYASVADCLRIQLGSADGMLAAIPDTPQKAARIRDTEQYVLSRNPDATQADVEKAALTEAWFRNAILRGAYPGEPKYHRDAESLNAVLKADMVEGTDTAGGYMVPSLVQSEVLRAIADSSQVYSVSRHIPMNTSVITIPTEATAATVNWGSEADTLTAGEPVLGQLTLTANRISGYGVATIELLEDSVVSVLPYLQSGFAEAIGVQLDQQALVGTTPFTGLYTAASVNEVAATTSTAGDDVTYNLLVNTLTALTRDSARQGAKWFMNPAMYGKVLQLTDTNSTPLVQSFSGISTLFGKEIIITSNATNVTVGSDACGRVFFGNPKQLIFGNRSMSFEVSRDVHFSTYKVAARLVGRFGFGIGVPGDFVRLVKAHAD